MKHSISKIEMITLNRNILLKYKQKMFCKLLVNEEILEQRVLFERDMMQQSWRMNSVYHNDKRVLNRLDHPIQQNVFGIEEDDPLFEHPLVLINHEK